MKWISTTDQMRRSDAYVSEVMNVPSVLLMEAAARAVADRLCELVQKDDDVLVLCGSGNNGGDGFAVARILKHRGYSVRVFCSSDPERIKGDARTNYNMLSAYSVSVLTMDQGAAFNHIAEESEWVVDALFGTGLDRELRGYTSQIVNNINKLKADGICKVLSIDIPSGVNGDTGEIMGTAIRADETVTFCRLKPGLLLYPGCDCAGKITVADIGIPESIPPMQEAACFRLEPADLKTIVPDRKSRSHKGLYGRVLSLAGSREMMGAAFFSAGSAYKVGAGLVECLVPRDAAATLMNKLPEAITFPYEDEETADFSWLKEKAENATTVLCGPGLSKKPYAKVMLQQLLETLPAKKTLVLDADALNLLAEDETLKQLVRGRGGNTVLTPHMGEASRLLGKSVAQLMGDPVRYAREIALEYQSIAVLKDALTLVAENKEKGRVFFNSTGNNGMSTAGSGDVLTGVIAGLSAQGMQPFDAACSGVYIHGAAGDLAREEKGCYALMAGDILNALHVEKICGKE